MDPTPFFAFERAQELMDNNSNLSYEEAIKIAWFQLGQVDA